VGNNVCFSLYYQPKDDDKNKGLDTIIRFCGAFALHFLKLKLLKQVDALRRCLWMGGYRPELSPKSIGFDDNHCIYY
jgi:hypothetical protein